MPVPFQFMLIFNIKGVKSSGKNNGSYTEKYQDHIPCSFAYKVVCVDNKFSKKVVKEYDYCKKVVKKHFNKNLIMSAEEERFQLSNSC